MRIEPFGFGLSVSAKQLGQLSGITPAVPATADVPEIALMSEEAQVLFSSAAGMQLQGIAKRLSLFLRGGWQRKRDSYARTVWAAALFGDSSDEDFEDEETENLAQFFGEVLRQGDICDCYLVAAFYASLKNPYIGKKGLADMVSAFEWPNMDDASSNRTFYGVRFPGYPEQPLNVDGRDVARGVQVSGGLGFQIMERAFAQLSGRLSITNAKSAYHLDDELHSINGGGYMGVGLHALTGNSVEVILNDPLQPRTERFAAEVAALLAQVRQNPQHYMVLACTDWTRDRNSYSDPERRFVNWHVYALEIHPRTDSVVIVNPWDTQKNRHSLIDEEFVRYFMGIAWTPVSQQLIAAVDYVQAAAG